MPVVGFGLFIAVGHIVVGLFEHGPIEPLKLASDAAASFSLHVFGILIVAMIAAAIFLLYRYVRFRRFLRSMSRNRSNWPGNLPPRP